MSQKLLIAGLVRKSTSRQDNSFVRQYQGLTRRVEELDGELTAVFLESKSGGASLKDRAVLNSALAYCLATGATLVVSDTDRLTRSMETLIDVERSGVAFSCADIPLILQGPMFRKYLRDKVTVAEFEREIISERVKSGIATQKQLAAARGETWKCGGTDEGRAAGGAVLIERAKTQAEQWRATLLPYAAYLRERKWSFVASRLNLETDRDWHPETLKRTTLRLWPNLEIC